MTRDPWINVPLARLAIDHPFLFCLSGGLFVTAWGAFLFRNFAVGLLWGAVSILVGLALWAPSWGPLRRYVRRRLGEE